jgi:hypothetical protein
MIEIIKSIVKYFRLFGINIVQFVNVVRGIPSFIRDYIQLKKEVDITLFPIELYPILDDKYKQGGTANGHYFHQDLVVAKKIYDANPKKHIDIGSRVDGFVAHLAVFREVVIIDIRDLTSQTKNI